MTFATIPYDTVYHYCSARAFLPIAATGRFWASDLSFMNDPREFNIGRDRILRRLIALTSVEKDPNRVKVLAKLDFHLRQFVDKFAVLSFCLSESRDELHQWFEYGDRSRGFCIGFNPIALLRSSCRVSRVKYEDDSLDTTIDSLITDCVEECLSGNLHQQLFAASNELIQAIASIKSNKWQYEREVRLTHLVPKASIGLKFNDEVHEHFRPIYEDSLGSDGIGDDIHVALNFREARGSLVPYVALEFGDISIGERVRTASFKEVILGYQNPNSEEHIAGVLRYYGYDGFSVVRSECEHR